MGSICNPAPKDSWTPSTRRRLYLSNVTDLIITSEDFVVENPQSFHSVYDLTDKFLGKGNYTEDVLKRLAHPNIVRIFEFFEDSKRYYILMELCPGKELYALVSHSHCLPESQSAQIMEQLLSAVSYCHSQGIVHRDLKPENVIVDVRGTDLIVKLIDFDSATGFEVGQQIHGAYGTAYSMAPEVILGEYDEKCDVWSAGVILYILITGNPPFSGFTDRAVKTAVLEDQVTMGKDWDLVSSEAKELVSKMLAKDPRQRISAKEAYLHPWIQRYSSKVQMKIETGMEISIGIREFNTLNKLKKRVRSFIVGQVIDTRDFTELREIFTLLDSNGDGLLSREDLIGLLESRTGRDEAVIQTDSLLQATGLRTDGLINYHMFVSAAADKHQLMSEDNLRTAFVLLDRKGTGNVRSDELRKWLFHGNLLEDSMWKRMIQDLDADDSGAISMQKFLNAMVESRCELEEEINVASPL